MKLASVLLLICSLWFCFAQFKKLKATIRKYNYTKYWLAKHFAIPGNAVADQLLKESIAMLAGVVIVVVLIFFIVCNG